ncbi:MAG TPA: hypothetical protein VMS96_12350 [Terriglobales bacterium]|nr:hypothetical protein [Terriglobales bacterium]
MRRALILSVLAGLSLSAALLIADDKVFVAPKAYHANTYPARDEHPLEHVSIAADPYDLPDKTAGVFRVPYKQAGFVPIRLIVSNDGDSTLVLSDMKAELITVRKVKIRPAVPDDIYRRIAKQGKRPDEPRTVPLPIPRKAKPSVSKEAQDEVEASGFLARAVEPHSTQAGFLYFDVEGISNPLAGAYLYVTGLRDAGGQELMYFEIPLEKYLSYRPGH